MVAGLLKNIGGRKMFNKARKATATTVLTVSILTSATMITANAATINYTVKPGDTLSAIAKKYRVSLKKFRIC